MPEHPGDTTTAAALAMAGGVGSLVGQLAGSEQQAEERKKKKRRKSKGSSG
jgi:IMP dehydrogenase/GMP reductase